MLALFEESPDDSVLIFTGDLVHGPDEYTEEHWPDYLGTPYRDESPEVVRLFREAQARYPGRVHCLLGNHEHAHVGGPRTAKFHHDEAKLPVFGHQTACLGAHLEGGGRRRVINENLRLIQVVNGISHTVPVGVLQKATPQVA